MKPTLTILIPAHNEEANITSLLASIMRQKQPGYTLREVVVLCDGCTDNTRGVALAFSTRHRAVRVVSDNRRIGKNKRLEEAFKTIKSELIGVFDGDMMLAHSQVLDSMVRHFTDKQVAIAGANNVPVPDRGFEYGLITLWTNFWFKIKLRLKDGNNIHNVRSCCLMTRTAFVRGLAFPDRLLSFGQFVYLAALHDRLRFRFEKEAVVYYRIPVSVSDYAVQKKRVKNERGRLSEIFGPWINEEYRIPLSTKITTLFYLMVRHPIQTAVSVAFKIFLTVYIKNKQYTMKGNIWSAAATTKRGMDMRLFDRDRQYLWR